MQTDIVANKNKITKKKSIDKQLININDIQYPLINQYFKLYKKNITKLKNNYIDKIKIETNKPAWIKHYIYQINYNEYNKYLLLYENWEDNAELNSITDYFTQYERIKCNFSHHVSPLTYFNTNKEKIVNQFNLIDTMSKKIPVLTIRQNIKNFNDYMFNNCKFCNNFRISICMKILNIFKPKRWLDISSGWGDRLISSYLYGVDEYCGCDPNLNLTKGYDQIIKYFKSFNPNEVVTIGNCGFENLKIPHKNYDIVLTSPPFFDLEKYSDYKDDSLVNYNTLEIWYQKFLLTVLKKAADHLNNQGHMVLYIDFVQDKRYIKRMIDDVNKFMNFKGCIYYYSNNKRLRPFFIWCKK